MISNKNNTKIDLMQKAITITCIIITVACASFAGLYLTGSEMLRKERVLFMSPSLTLSPLEEEIAELGRTLERQSGSRSRFETGVEAGVSVVQAEESESQTEAQTEVIEKKPDAAPVIVAPVRPRVTDGGVVAVRKALQAKDYSKANELLSGMRRTDEVDYLRAKTVFGLYLQESASGAQVVNAWSRVRTSNPAGSDKYNEADSILNLFGK